MKLKGVIVYFNPTKFTMVITEDMKPIKPKKNDIIFNFLSFFILSLIHISEPTRPY